jgi:hypothetical protein
VLPLIGKNADRFLSSQQSQPTPRFVLTVIRFNP